MYLKHMKKQKINVSIGIIGENIIKISIIVDVEKNRRNIIYGKENESMFFLWKDRR